MSRVVDGSVFAALPSVPSPGSDVGHAGASGEQGTDPATVPAPLTPTPGLIDGLSFSGALTVAYRDLIYAGRMLDAGEEHLEDSLRQILDSAGRLIAFFQPITLDGAA